MVRLDWGGGRESRGELAQPTPLDTGIKDPNVASVNWAYFQPSLLYSPSLSLPPPSIQTGP